MMICPKCRGRGQVLALVDYSSGASDVGERTCRTCNGTGNLTQEQLNKLAIGDQLRRERVGRNQSLHERAAELGISITQLSDLENGRVSKEDLGLA